MTEEIIEVNGLNVTECTHLSDCVLCDYTENYSQFCSDYDNCYYKQLKRLEQENKKLKKANEISIEKVTVTAEIKRLQELEQENKELKKENIKVKKEFNNLIVEIISDIKYTGEITCNGESPKEHLKKCQKALKTLEEIRDYCEKCKKCVETGDEVILYTVIKKANEILDKG